MLFDVIVKNNSLDGVAGSIYSSPMLIGPPFPPDKPKKVRKVLSRMTSEEQESYFARKATQQARRAAREAKQVEDSASPPLTAATLIQHFALAPWNGDGLVVRDEADKSAKIVYRRTKRSKAGRGVVELFGREDWLKRVVWLIENYQSKINE